MNFHEAAAFFETDKGPRLPTTRPVAPPHDGGPPVLGHGYTYVYEREFSRVVLDVLLSNPSRTKDATPGSMLEIGVQMGCSLRLWDWYFGEKRNAPSWSPDPNRGWMSKWKIIGLEVNLVPGLQQTLTATMEKPERVHLVEGSSTDPVVAKKVGADHGPFDIVIDDGSHWPKDQIDTFRNFWPLVKPGGIYCLEDLHQSWWVEGARQGSIVPALTQLLEDCIGRGKWAEWSGIPVDNPQPTYAEEQFFSMRVYRNMVVFEKRQTA